MDNAADWEQRGGAMVDGNVEVSSQGNGKSENHHRGATRRKSHCNKSSVDCGNYYRSRARPLKPHETHPFLSIENVAAKEEMQPGQMLVGSSQATTYSVNVPKAPVNTPMPRVMSASSGGWNSLVPRKNKYLPDAAKVENSLGPQIKNPFKHSVKKSDGHKANVNPDQVMKEKTALATYQVAKAMAKQSFHQEKKQQGRLLKAKLKPMGAVKVDGPGIDKCRGIVSVPWSSLPVAQEEQQEPEHNIYHASEMFPHETDPFCLLGETRSYSASPSKTLQRRRNILASISKDYLYERPQTGESIHRTSIASDLSEGRDNDLNDDLEDQRQGATEISIPPNSQASASRGRNKSSQGRKTSHQSSGNETRRESPSGKAVRFVASYEDEPQAPVAAGDAEREENDDEIDPDFPVDSSDEDVEEEEEEEDGAGDAANMNSNNNNNKKKKKNKNKKEDPRPNPQQQTLTLSNASDGFWDAEIGDRRHPQPVTRPRSRLGWWSDHQKPDKNVNRLSVQGSNHGQESGEETSPKVKSKVSVEFEKPYLKNMAVYRVYGRLERPLGSTPAEFMEEEKRKLQKMRPSSALPMRSVTPVMNHGLAGPSNDTRVRPMSAQTTHCRPVTPRSNFMTAKSVKFSTRESVDVGNVERITGVLRPRSVFRRSRSDVKVIARPRSAVERLVDEGNSRRCISCGDNSDQVSHAAGSYFAVCDTCHQRTKLIQPREVDLSITGHKLGEDQREWSRESELVEKVWPEEPRTLATMGRYDLLELSANDAMEHLEELSLLDLEESRSGSVSEEADRLVAEALSEAARRDSDKVQGSSVCSSVSELANHLVTEVLDDVTGDAIGKDAGSSSSRSAVSEVAGNIVSYVLDNLKEECRNYGQGPEEESSPEEAECVTPVTEDPQEPEPFKDGVKSLDDVHEEMRGCLEKEEENDFGMESAPSIPTPAASEGAPGRNKTYMMSVYQYKEDDEGRGEVGEYEVTLMKEEGVKTTSLKEQNMLNFICTELTSSFRAKKKTNSTLTRKTSGDTPAEVLATVKALAQQRKSGESKYPEKVSFQVNARPPQGLIYYFTYGQDMNPSRLSSYIDREICERFWGLLYGFKLVDEKSSEDGCCQPKLEFDVNGSVEGCVYLLSPEDLERLDENLGQPQRLEHVMLPVWLLNSSGDLSVAQFCVPTLTYISAQDGSVVQECVSKCQNNKMA